MYDRRLPVARVWLSAMISSVRIGGLAAVILLSGCSWIYRQNVEQGNLIQQDMVDQLKPGMSRRQVTLILGSPAVQSPFHEQRWDYTTSTKDGRTGEFKVTKLTLHFQGDQLARIEGDYKPGGSTDAAAGAAEQP